MRMDYYCCWWWWLGYHNHDDGDDDETVYIYLMWMGVGGIWLSLIVSRTPASHYGRQDTLIWIFQYTDNEQRILCSEIVEMLRLWHPFWPLDILSKCSKESKDLILGCINEGFMQGCFLNTLHIHNFDPCSLNIAQRPLAFLKSVAIEIASAGYFPFLFSCAFVRMKFNQKSFF